MQPQEPPHKLLLTIKEAAQLAGVSIPTMYQWMNNEGLPNLKIGRVRRIPRQELENWIKEKAHGSAA
jgi:excisionase family DNA binding protein